MGASQGRSKVMGICIIFQYNPKSRELFLDHDHPFFYGNELDFTKNYGLVGEYNTRRHPFNPDELAAYLDKPYAATFERQAKKGSGFYFVPIDEMRLGSSQKGLVRKLMEKAVLEMPTWVANLEVVHKSLDDVKERKSFNAHFASFPQALREAAIEEGSFLTFWTNLETRTREELRLPTAHIIYSPVGGLPGWARDYVHRANRGV